jgi:hypothetical protein
MSDGAHKANGIDIDAVVREVLSRLGQEMRLAAVEAADTGRLVVAARVVTLAELEGRLANVKHVVVPARAVVTPAAADRLREHNVTLSYAVPAATGAARATLVLGEAIADAGKAAFDVARLASTLTSEGVTVERSARAGLRGVVMELSERVALSGVLAAIVTDRPAVVTCLANRRRGVRAVGGANATELAAASSDIGANLLAIDPRGASWFAWKRTIGDFARQAPRSCPNELSDE